MNINPSIVRDEVSVTIKDTTKNVLFASFSYDNDYADEMGVALGNSYRVAKTILRKMRYTLTPNTVYHKTSNIVYAVGDDVRVAGKSVTSITSMANELGERQLLFRFRPHIDNTTKFVEACLTGEDLVKFELMLHDIIAHKRQNRH